MRTVYAITLGVEPRADAQGSDVFDQLRSRCEGWVGRKYQDLWGQTLAMQADDVPTSPLPGHIVRAHDRATTSGKLFVLEWSHPHDQDPASMWNTTITIVQHGAAVELTILLRVAATQAVIRPVEFSLGRPRLLSEVLVDFRVARNGRPLQESPTVLATSDVAAFVEGELLSADRLDPVIVISPDLRTDVPLVDARAILARIREFAKVFVLQSRWAAFKLTDVVGKPLSCFDGAVRTYWPGFTQVSSPFDHQLILRSAIRPGVEGTDYIARRLFSALAAVSAFRHVEGTGTLAVRRELAESDQAAIEQLRQAAKSGTADRTQLEHDLLEALCRVDELQRERDDLQQELVAQKALWAEYQNYRSTPEHASDREVHTLQKEWQSEYESVAEAVAAAKEQFSGPLVFLDSAHESARESPFSRPQRVYELFRALHEVASEWRANGGKLGMSWKEALADRGFDFKEHISQTSEGKYGTEYRFKWKGKQVLFAPHVTLGAKQVDKCLSVHLYRDEQDCVLVVGHCGRHLKNTRT